jgi:hemoglobin
MDLTSRNHRVFTKSEGVMDIYQKYGGFDFFHRIIYDLYLELFDHPEISMHFIGVDIERLSKMQTEFLGEAIGAGPIYKGGDIKVVHKEMGITKFQFEIVAKRFAQIFQEHGLQPDEVKFIMQFVGSYQGAIVTSKYSLMDRIMRPIYKFFYFLRGKKSI